MEGYREKFRKVGGEGGYGYNKLTETMRIDRELRELS